MKAVRHDNDLMLYLTESDVRRFLPMKDCIGLIHKAFERLASGEALNHPRRRLARHRTADACSGVEIAPRSRRPGTFVNAARGGYIFHC